MEIRGAQREPLPVKVIAFQGEEIRTFFLNKKTVIKDISGLGEVVTSDEEGNMTKDYGCFDKDEAGYYYMNENDNANLTYNGKVLGLYEKQYVRNGDTIQVLPDDSTKEVTTLIYFTHYFTSFDWYIFQQLDQLYGIDVGREGHTVNIDHGAVSQNHATFFRDGQKWNIADHNSITGVYVNNIKIEEQVLLQKGDSIRIANVVFIFTGNSIIYQKYKDVQSVLHKAESVVSTIPEDVLSVRIRERSIMVKTNKIVLLQDINVDIHNGEFVLILGGSGAGKTTFMNAVMGYEKADGQIIYEKNDIYADYDLVKHKIGFVPQQDLLRGSDTVYDTVYNTAQMKLPVGTKRSKIQERVQEVIEVMGLDRERKTLVSKLSGGQRKRLSIAVEYIADPSLFFLDEPDSGLDGIMAKTLMQNLRMIADKNKIVMVISHAPDRTSQLFDKVIILAKSEVDNCGHLAFFGGVKETLEFFDADCLEGVVQKINRTDEGGDGLADHYINKYKNQG